MPTVISRHQTGRTNANLPPVGKAAAHLEQIVWGKPLDAENFFRSSIPLSNPRGHLTWSRLKTISLVCDHFNPGDYEGIKKVLIAAARAVRYMSRLECLELWRIGIVPDGWGVKVGPGGYDVSVFG